MVNCATAKSERGKEAVGRSALSRIQIYLSYCHSFPPVRKKYFVTILLPSPVELTDS